MQSVARWAGGAGKGPRSRWHSIGDSWNPRRALPGPLCWAVMAGVTIECPGARLYGPADPHGERSRVERRPATRESALYRDKCMLWKGNSRFSTSNSTTRPRGRGGHRGLLWLDWGDLGPRAEGRLCGGCSRRMGSARVDAWAPLRERQLRPLDQPDSAAAAARHAPQTGGPRQLDRSSAPTGEQMDIE